MGDVSLLDTALLRDINAGVGLNRRPSRGVARYFKYVKQSLIAAGGGLMNNSGHLMVIDQRRELQAILPAMAIITGYIFVFNDDSVRKVTPS